MRSRSAARSERSSSVRAGLALEDRQLHARAAFRQQRGDVLAAPVVDDVVGHHHDHEPVRDSWRLVVRVVGIGRIEDGTPELVRPATVWNSATPFTPSRYPGRHDTWPDFLAEQVRRELRHRGLPEPRAVAVVDGDWREVLRSRPSRWGGRRGTPNRASAYLRLTFDEPVSGPIALGQLSHFGLGLFAPE